MKIKCKICGKRFMPNSESIYQAVESLSVSEVLTKGAKTIDVIDCPRCGCQRMLAIRMNKVQKTDPMTDGETDV